MYFKFVKQCQIKYTYRKKQDQQAKLSSVEHAKGFFTATDDPVIYAGNDQEVTVSAYPLPSHPG